jgi:plastocyanin
MKTPVPALAFALVCSAAAVASTAASTPPAPAATVHIKNFAYHRSTVTVHAGDTVTFVNDDDDAHTVTASDKTFDSGGLDSGQTFTRTFAKAGTYAYFCALHPYMKAVVIVLPAAQATP